MVDCDELESGPPDGNPDHGPYCQRGAGSKANAVTEPGWATTQFWCSVISPYLHGTHPTSYYDDCQKKYRDGVLLTALVDGEIVVKRDPGGSWGSVQFNMTPAEARQLAARPIGAADRKDGVSQSPNLLRRLEKMADHLGVEIWGP